MTLEFFLSKVGQPWEGSPSHEIRRKTPAVHQHQSWPFKTISCSLCRWCGVPTFFDVLRFDVDRNHFLLLQLYSSLVLSDANPNNNLSKWQPEEYAMCGVFLHYQEFLNFFIFEKFRFFSCAHLDISIWTFCQNAHFFGFFWELLFHQNPQTSPESPESPDTYMIKSKSVELNNRPGHYANLHHAWCILVSFFLRFFEFLGILRGGVCKKVCLLVFLLMLLLLGSENNFKNMHSVK